MACTCDNHRTCRACRGDTETIGDELRRLRAEVAALRKVAAIARATLPFNPHDDATWQRKIRAALDALKGAPHE